MLSLRTFKGSPLVTFLLFFGSLFIIKTLAQPSNYNRWEDKLPSQQLLIDELTIRRDQLKDCNREIEDALAKLKWRQSSKELPKDINTKMPMIEKILRDEFGEPFNKGITHLSHIISCLHNDHSNYGCADNNNNNKGVYSLSQDDFDKIHEVLNSLVMYIELTEPLRLTKEKPAHFVTFKAKNLNDGRLRKLFYTFVLIYYGIHDHNE